jgi:hypothetical protein
LIRTARAGRSRQRGETGFVTDAVDWKYSSARNYANNDHGILEIDLN